MHKFVSLILLLDESVIPKLFILFSYFLVSDWSFEIMNNIRETNGDKFCMEAMKTCQIKSEEKDITATAAYITNVRSECYDDVVYPITFLPIDKTSINTDVSESEKYHIIKNLIQIFIRNASILRCHVITSDETIYRFFIFTFEKDGDPTFILESKLGACVITSEILAMDDITAHESNLI